MCTFGFNAGGGSYLPRQGSFVIQPNDTFLGLTGPGVVKSVLGEDITPDALGGPKVHGASHPTVGWNFGLKLACCRSPRARLVT